MLVGAMHESREHTPSLECSPTSVRVVGFIGIDRRLVPQDEFVGRRRVIDIGAGHYDLAHQSGELIHRSMHLVARNVAFALSAITSRFAVDPALPGAGLYEGRIDERSLSDNQSPLIQLRVERFQQFPNDYPAALETGSTSNDLARYRTG